MSNSQQPPAAGAQTAGAQPGAQQPAAAQTAPTQPATAPSPAQPAGAQPAVQPTMQPPAQPTPATQPPAPPAAQPPAQPAAARASAPPPAPPPAAPTPGTNTGKRKRMMTILVLVILIAAIAYGLYYFLVARFSESTDDAQVNGNVVQITPQVVGTVISVNADDTQVVKTGDALVVLDPADARVALQQAEASLAQTVRQVRGYFANDNQFAAQVAVRQADLARAQADLNRRLAVTQTGAVSQEEISHARDAASSARAALDAARQQLAANRALTTNTTIASHPNVLAAAAKVRDAYLANARNVLPAPVTGYVAKRSVQVGQRVSPGTPLMSVVPLGAVWVDANFKEVQLKHMHLGQPVRMTSDIYGSSVVYHGKVIGFSAGTGSAFSLLPAQNATGNWIKVVQRLPVRVSLDPAELNAHPLRIGLSMQVDVDIHNESGGQLGNAPTTVYQTDVFDKYGEQADAEIARIIAQNSGQAVPAAETKPAAARPPLAPSTPAPASASISAR